VSAAWPDLAVQPPWPEDAVEVARIGEAWGVKGWFRVIPFATDPQAIFSSRRWFIKPPEQAAIAARPGGHSAFPEWLKITDAKSHGDGAVAHAQGLETRADAQALRGARVFVARSSFPTESADEYYWVDLIGLQVFNRKGDSLGTVQGLIDTGPQSVLRVAAALESGTAAGADSATRATERLIPFVAAYVDDVSLEARRITVDWELDY
jgi:16S rRNA processing protein RimM